MGLALDEPGNDDERHEHHGLTFLVDDEAKRLLDMYGGLLVDYDDQWGRFRVNLGRGEACC